MAKSFNNLWCKMIDPDNIEAAIYAAARGKRRKREVQKALRDVDGTVARIRDMLENDEWRPPEIRDGWLFSDGIARKERLLVRPDFDEQIVHHLLIDFVVEPIFRPRFFEWTCGSVPGRGQEGMARHVIRKILRSGDKVRYGAILDIRKCFRSIDVECIYSAIAKRIRDKRVMHIVRLVLDSNAIRMPDGSIQDGGVPIGLFTSPWFVNIALTEVDMAIKSPKSDGSRRDRRAAMYLYVRYIDDMLIMHGNKRELRRAMNDVVSKLSTMGMALKRKPEMFRFGESGVRKLRFTGFHVTRSRMCVRDKVFVRAVRTGANMRKKVAAKRRITAHESERLIAYGGRFRAFGSYNAFPLMVLRGLNFALLRRKVSERDRKRNKTKR